jgi:hypothetical protein
MRIELVRENLADGSTRYSVEIDGTYVSGSVTRDEDEARAIYAKCVQFRGMPTREVIESTEVES